MNCLKKGNRLKNESKSRRVGLARALSKLGYCSRTAGFALAQAGRVRVNGVVRRDPEFPVHPAKDRIEADGHPVEPGPRLYLKMNKPRGVVTTAADEKGRQTVYAYLDANLPWVAPAGRLDKASQGLLLLTNDSEWASQVSAPETHLDKTYHVQLGVVAGAALLESMQRGVRTEGGVLRVKRAAIVRRGEKNTWLEVVLDEGKNRQIRKILAALGIEVLQLVRVAIGPLALGELKKGEVRQLTAQEKQALDRSMGRG
jgi:23S rRNA pseudouridine2605 synthase